MEQAKLFQFIAEHTLEMMIVFAADGRILYANPLAESKLKYTDRLQHYSIVDIFPKKEDIRESFNKSTEEMQMLMAYRGNKV